MSLATHGLSWFREKTGLMSLSAKDATLAKSHTTKWHLPPQAANKPRALGHEVKVRACLGATNRANIKNYRPLCAPSGVLLLCSVSQCTLCAWPSPALCCELGALRSVCAGSRLCDQSLLKTARACHHAFIVAPSPTLYEVISA